MVKKILPRTLGLVYAFTLMLPLTGFAVDQPAATENTNTNLPLLKILIQNVFHWKTYNVFRMRLGKLKNIM